MKKSEIQSAIGTAIISGIILAILCLFGLSLSQEDMEEGVMIRFGDNIDGYGEQTSHSAPSTPSSPKPITPKPSDPLMTQDDESIALEQERKKRIEEERRQQQEEQRKIEEEHRAEEKRKAEELEKERKTQAAQNLASGAFNQSSGQGSGTTTGEAMQGNPAGNGAQGGHSWSLSGRNLKGKLFEPAYTSNEEGTIVVNIRVDNSGKVTEASIGPGTDITNEALRKATLEAAKKNVFSAGPGIVLGTITYKFSLR